MVYIGIDLGGTNVKGLIINEKGEVLKQHYIPTQDNGDFAWRVNVKEMVDYLAGCTEHKIVGIGMSAPGLPDEQNRCIAYLPNRLNGLENFKWGEYLGYATYVLNDAHSALMAEATFGAAKGYKNVVLLTLGTGVGGGIMINGQLYQGLAQMAGHLGHIAIDSQDDELSILGSPGSLEYAIGNYSIKKRSLGKFESTWQLTEAYRKGDSWATLIWLTSIKKLAISISSLINALSPEIVVLAGGITLADEALYKPLQEFMDLYEFRPNKQTPIVQAYFGDMAGAIGAASFAINKMN
jgi:glucokinase